MKYLPKWAAHLYEEARFSQGYEKSMEGVKDCEGNVVVVHSIAYHIFHELSWYIVNLYCWLRGHDWEDTSYGGPESGEMSGYCKRCGFSFHETLY